MATWSSGDFTTPELGNEFLRKPFLLKTTPPIYGFLREDIAEEFGYQSFPCFGRIAKYLGFHQSIELAPASTRLQIDDDVEWVEVYRTGDEWGTDAVSTENHLAAASPPSLVLQPRTGIYDGSTLGGAIGPSRWIRSPHPDGPLADRPGRAIPLRGTARPAMPDADGKRPVLHHPPAESTLPPTLRQPEDRRGFGAKEILSDLSSWSSKGDSAHGTDEHRPHILEPRNIPPF